MKKKVTINTNEILVSTAINVFFNWNRTTCIKRNISVGNLTISYLLIRVKWLAIGRWTPPFNQFKVLVRWKYWMVFSTVKGSRLGLRNRMLLKRTGAALLDHGWRSTDSLTIQMDSLHRSFILAVSILFFFSILFGIPAASTVVDPPTVSSLPTNQTFASGRSFYHRPPPTNQLVLPLATIPNKSAKPIYS